MVVRLEAKEGGEDREAFFLTHAFFADNLKAIT